jgi:hypothetical protein
MLTMTNEGNFSETGYYVMYPLLNFRTCWVLFVESTFSWRFCAIVTPSLSVDRSKQL